MKFRDFSKTYPTPTKTGDEPWDYSKTPIYDQILSCFWETQRPQDAKEYKASGKTRLRDPFRKINKHKIQTFLGHLDGDNYQQIDWVEDETGSIKAIILYYDLNKMSVGEKKINSFCNKTYTLSKIRGDKYIKEIACHPGYEDWLEKLIEKHIAKSTETSKFFATETPATFVETDNQIRSNRNILQRLGFVCIDNIITSFADVYGIWVKGGSYAPIERAQQLSLQRLDVPTQDTSKIMEQILKLDMDGFANHYSNYNKGNSWKGVVVRGYGGIVDFIIKPQEMSSSWKKDNPEKLEWKVENTPLRNIITEVEHFLDVLKENLPHLKDESHIERIRILKLSKGEGELERHTDRQDKDAGIGDGQWTRIHFPLQTNPDVKFTQWNYDGSKTTTRMGVGECWYLDMRKPHTAVNFGEEDRYHLVIDIQSNSQTRRWLEKGADKYPTLTEADDYVE